MTTDHVASHRVLAESVRRAVLREGPVTDAALRGGVMTRAAGGAAIPEPYDDLARQVGEDASRVTDAQVEAVRASTGSDKGAFEVVLSAAIGAGLVRWDAAARAIEEVGGASS